MMTFRSGAGFEELDDDPVAAAAWTSRWEFIGHFDGFDRGWRILLRHAEQLTRSFDIAGAMAIGEQAVMTDAMEPFWEDVDQETPDEFIDR